MLVSKTEGRSLENCSSPLQKVVDLVHQNDSKQVSDQESSPSLNYFTNNHDISGTNQYYNRQHSLPSDHASDIDQFLAIQHN